METTSMGKVVVTARIENLEDLFNAERGLISADDVRSLEVVDALVDTGATGLLVPKSMIARLGLTQRGILTRPRVRLKAGDQPALPGDW